MQPLTGAISHWHSGAQLLPCRSSITHSARGGGELFETPDKTTANCAWVCDGRLHVARVQLLEALRTGAGDDELQDRCFALMAEAAPDLQPSPDGAPMLAPRRRSMDDRLSLERKRASLHSDGGAIIEGHETPDPEPQGALLP